MNTKTTHIQKVRQSNLEAMHQVQQILSWSHDRYCQYQFQQYCRFVEEITQGWDLVRKEIMYSPVFRGFWNNEWNARDHEDFLCSATDCEDSRYNLEEYLFLHDTDRLMEDDDFMHRYSNILNIIRYGS